jgi:hypothetical protein
MPRQTNFANPDFEPTDDELGELMREAFAGIKEAKARSLQEMHERIAKAQAEMRNSLKAFPSPVTES